jgi:hypothetical protein
MKFSEMGSLGIGGVIRVLDGCFIFKGRMGRIEMVGVI